MSTSSPIEQISAITLAVGDMARAVSFYEKLGFTLFYGEPRSGFSSLRAGDAVVNLAARPGYESVWWGRVIFRVADVDARHRALVAQGLSPDPPTDAPWGERYFHIWDPDGHELSFAQLLQDAGPGS